MHQSITSSARLALLLSVAIVGLARAQTAVAPTIPIRQLPAASATSTDSLGSVAAVRQLPSGNVLVNDQARRRVVLMDSSMTVIGVVADSTSSSNNAYGARPGGMIAYRGDSTLFIEPASLSMLVIDPAGKIVRTMAAPRANDVQFLIGGSLGNPGFDARGRLVYRTMEPDVGLRGARLPQPGQPWVAPMPPDSAALVRFDLATRTLDTVGFFKIARSNVRWTPNATGGIRTHIMIHPLPVVDEWAVMSDGTVAFVRGKDYHVDFIDATGERTSAEKIPYEWQRMTDDDKSRFLDSSKVAIEKLRAAAAAGNAGAAQSVMETVLGDGGVGGAPPMARAGDGPTPTRGDGPAPPRRGDSPPGGVRGGMQMPAVEMVPASELADYKPVFGAGSVKADMDGRLWVRTIPTKLTPGGAIYNVIDKSGKLADRVQVPANTTIAGFGKGGVVYLGLRDATGIRLQRIVLK